MDAIELLISQHREVDELFERLESKEGDAEQIFSEIADALAVHATIEEKIFYPGTKSARTEDLLREAVEEHLGVKRIIADLLELGPDDETFEAKCKVLKEQVQHHVKEEEEELFPKVKKLVAANELEQMAVEMEAMAEELLAEGDPRDNVPAETDQAAPI